jgi:hypothetical protein
MRIPANQDHLGNNAWEGGLILPFAVELPKGFSLGLMSEFDFVSNEAGKQYHPQSVNSITLRHDIIRKNVPIYAVMLGQPGRRWGHV